MSSIVRSILSIQNLKTIFLQHSIQITAVLIKSLHIFFSFRRWPGLVLSRLFVSSPHFSLFGDFTKLENPSFSGPITKSTELHLLQFLVIDSLKIHSESITWLAFWFMDFSFLEFARKPLSLCYHGLRCITSFYLSTSYPLEFM